MPGALDFDAAGALAALRAKSAPEPSTPPNPPNHLIGGWGEAAGLGGLGGLGEGRLSNRISDPVAARTAFYLQAMAEAAAALAEPDADLAAERAVMAQHYAEPAAP